LVASKESTLGRRRGGGGEGCPVVQHNRERKIRLLFELKEFCRPEGEGKKKGQLPLHLFPTPKIEGKRKKKASCPQRSQYSPTSKGKEEYRKSAAPLDTDDLSPRKKGNAPAVAPQNVASIRGEKKRNKGQRWFSLNSIGKKKIGITSFFRWGRKKEKSSAISDGRRRKKRRPYYSANSENLKKKTSRSIGGGKGREDSRHQPPHDEVRARLP